MLVKASAVATAVGVGRSVVELSPSWPWLLAPQHQAVPALVRPQVCAAPAASCAKVRLVCTFTGVSAQAKVPPSMLHVVVAGAPSCPLSSRPQHQATPSVVRPHVWAPPVATDAKTSGGGLVTVTVALSVLPFALTRMTAVPAASACTTAA